MDPERQRAELIAKAEALTAEAEAPAELAGQPGIFRLATKILAVLTLLGIVLGVVGENTLFGFGIFIAVTCGMGLVFIGFTDLIAPKARDRSTAGHAVHTYFHSLQKGRFDMALATLAPIARQQMIMRPEVKELRSFQKACSRETKKELREYWKPLIRGGGSLSRRLAKVNFTPLDTEGLIHRYRVELRIEYYPTWVLAGLLLGLWPALILILALTKKYRTTFDVTLFKHKSQWWMLDGEFRAPIVVGTPDGHRIPPARVVR